MKRLALAISLLCTTVTSTALFNPMSAHAGEVHNRQVSEQRQSNRGGQNGNVSGAEQRNLERRQPSINQQHDRNSERRQPSINQQHDRNSERRQLPINQQHDRNLRNDGRHPNLTEQRQLNRR